MPRKSSTRSTHPVSNKSQRKQLKTLKLATRVDGNDVLEPPTKKPRSGLSVRSSSTISTLVRTPSLLVSPQLSKPPTFDLAKDDNVASSSSQGLLGSQSRCPDLQSQRPLLDIKGKRKATTTLVDEIEDSLWVDKYEPMSEAELAVHKRKVEDVRRWLVEAFEGGPSGKLRKYRRILALTGPAGTAKTATLRVLSKELDFEILEWQNSMGERTITAFLEGESCVDESSLGTETLFDKFQVFLTRAMSCNNIFEPRNAQSSRHGYGKRQLILLEDLPNLLHQPTLARFQAALRSLCIPTANPYEPPRPPIVIILSDSGLRAEQPDSDTWDSGATWRRWDKREVLDIRNVLGPELLTSSYVTRIGFNPIAASLMTKALQALLASHFKSLNTHERARKQLTREIIDIIVESSNGDIRSAIMTLQFACTIDLPSSSMKSKAKEARKSGGVAKRGANGRTVLEAVTRREQSLVLFHLMGKILYNKRRFDPPASHLSAKDAAKERELDLQLVDPPPLPVWLSHHDRKASRVCIETLMAESPIDSPLLGMYTHQNYTQFCTDVDQCDGVCEALSWVDCMAGAQLANSPYAFPTLTLSTLHALPTPVPRRGQRVCKPAWFDVHKQELEAWDAVGDVLGWLGRGMDHGKDQGTTSVSVGKWTHSAVATELGGWLRAFDQPSPTAGTLACGESHPQLPRAHRLFSHLSWTVEATGVDTHAMDEDEDRLVEDVGNGDEDLRLPGGVRGGDEGRWWLEEDDIEDVN